MQSPLIQLKLLLLFPLVPSLSKESELLFFFLYLPLYPGGQTPELDKPDGRRLVELVAFGISSQSVAVQGIGRFASDNGTITLVQFQADITGNESLRAVDIGAQVFAVSAEP